ncbi:TlpA family protein disulfide reductase [Chitinophaga agrisoli]|uniref:TlpA family protein disulfide reductase n=1 Tax=Chitinophaga agrisoli TaxID=2607653 RepID=A0A5B2VIG9_9BACT|nr:TlpA disulfide reductase family protein [Chitinophaga agrisoli]KAA2238715.1 TlpA family protein disulfide reductase [Chitinophaga agrisoli]
MPVKPVLYIILLHAFLLPASAQQVRLVTLDELERRFTAGGDTTYVINFWATWCGPCVDELPHFEKFRQTFKDEPVRVLLVSLDARSKLRGQVLPFVKKARLQNEVILLNETDQQQYIDRISPEWSGSLPATLFVNKGKQLRRLQEREFTYDQLVATFRSLK